VLGKLKRLNNASFPTSCAFRKSYFLPRGCACPRLAWWALAIAKENPTIVQYNRLESPLHPLVERL
jgi:hypothetical protein